MHTFCKRWPWENQPSVLFVDQNIDWGEKKGLPGSARDLLNLTGSWKAAVASWN